MISLMISSVPAQSRRFESWRVGKKPPPNSLCYRHNGVNQVLNKRSVLIRPPGRPKERTTMKIPGLVGSPGENGPNRIDLRPRSGYRP